MTQKPYFRDIWALGPPSKGYPGAFPRGLINMIRRRWWGRKRLWLFSGSHKDGDGIMVDIKSDLMPTVVANCEELPFNDNSFDFVMADPPYSKEESRRLYDLPYFSVIKVLNEMVRVCCDGGNILFLHRLIPQMHPQLSPGFTRLSIIGVVGIYTIAGMTNIRALTVWRKGESLGPLYDRF